MVNTGREAPPQEKYARNAIRISVRAFAGWPFTLSEIAKASKVSDRTGGKRLALRDRSEALSFRHNRHSMQKTLAYGEFADLVGSTSSDDSKRRKKISFRFGLQWLVHFRVVDQLSGSRN